MSLQSLRFIDYFVICGLNTEIGLESDQLLGEKNIRFSKVLIVTIGIRLLC